MGVILADFYQGGKGDSLLKHVLMLSNVFYTPFPSFTTAVAVNIFS